jgi:hypothetical protein
MSSLHCPLCHVRLWDKVQGNLRKYQEVNDTFYCLKCSKLLKPIKVEFEISIEDFQDILKENYTQKQIVKIFTNEIMREIINKKLGYNQYSLDDLTDILNDYSEVFKDE